MPEGHGFTKDTLVPLSLVFTLLGAAVSYGAMYNKIDQMQTLVENEREDRKEDIAELKDQVTTLNKTVLEYLGKQKDISLNNP